MLVDSERRRELTKKLNEDASELEYLQESLHKTSTLAEKMVAMLNSFDERLVKLEASILPIHKSTQSLTRVYQNIDKTSASIETILSYFDLAGREESVIIKGPNEQDVHPYLISIGRINAALDHLNQFKLKSAERVQSQLKQILKAALYQLESLFRRWLQQNSTPVDVLTYQEGTPAIPTAQVDRLRTLSAYLSSSETESGVATDFTKIYVEVRSQYLSRSLAPLAQASTSNPTVRSGAGGLYQKGSCGYIPYATALLRMLKAERALVDQLVPQGSTVQASVMNATCAAAIDSFIEAGEALVGRVRRNLSTDVFLLFDALEALSHSLKSFEDCLGPGTKKYNDTAELALTFSSTSLHSFSEFLEDVRGSGSKQQVLSADGTVHEITSKSLNYMRRLLDYQQTVERNLQQLGDGNWNSGQGSSGALSGQSSLERSASQQSRSGQLPSGGGQSTMQHYFEDVLTALLSNLEAKAKGYSKSKPVLGTIFLLNNYHYILKTIRNSRLQQALGRDGETRFDKLTVKQQNAYMDTWKPLIEVLMDVTYVRGGALKAALGSSEKQAIKDKFKKFNEDFEEMFKTQKSFAIPDADLRATILKEIRVMVVPMYSRFLEKYKNMDFTKNPSKYIKYDVPTLEAMVGKFFDTQA